MGTTRSFSAEQRQQQRDAKKRLRELERQLREQDKLSELEQARLEVKGFENRLEVLLSVHKEQSDTIDWGAIAAALPPSPPARRCLHEFRARLEEALRPKLDDAERFLQIAIRRDDEDYELAKQEHDEAVKKWRAGAEFAARVLAGEHKAYTEAIVEFSTLTEISDLGAEIRFTVHDAGLLECNLKVNGIQALPSETKALTSSGKVSVKPFPKTRFHEIYQDYVCSCVLRIAREVFALLPIDIALITAEIDGANTSTGETFKRPILSVAIPRSTVCQLDFETLDPSDTLETFLHRGDVKASKRSGEFEAIVPLEIQEIPRQQSQGPSFEVALSSCKELRNQILLDTAELGASKHSLTAINRES